MNLNSFALCMAAILHEALLAVLTLFANGFSLHELSGQHSLDATRYGLGRLDSRSIPLVGPNALLHKRMYVSG